ncbi:ATP-binding protein [Palleronia caenipelagi]|uniref:histidine kinase n=1 Tax=Palleronia caenipelagi TaxID=2489174 RepID=A0A547Q999_9RHOB|nr:ATP-binding protein [Palleronia caenipelagi]TRD22959.1 HAMP domain-containing protein [Palleronia caenipelagi]
MSLSWLKTYMPRSLYWRGALILLLPVVVLLVVVSVVFIQRLFEDVTVQMTHNVGLEVRHMLEQVDTAPSLETALPLSQDLADAFDMNAALPDPAPVSGETRAFYDISGRMIWPTLRDEIAALQGVDLVQDDGKAELTLTTRHGPLRLEIDRDRISAKNPHQLLVIMGLTALLISLVSFLFLRNQLRPIARLAEAATAFGRGRAVVYRPSGSTEVRNAGKAFLDMRNRIERQIEQRTTMLSGVSHDLRTPLARLNLGLEMSDDPEAPAMRQDVAEMRRMLDAFLDFARDGALDDPEPVRADEICQQLLEKAVRSGMAVEAGRIDPCPPVDLRPLAVSRAVENLLVNATRYGTRARLSLIRSSGSLSFVVEDDGPGIPKADRVTAMRAFTRLDSSRNQNQGAGVGLGLAIALDVARQHGGALVLDESQDLGGLQARLVLPI